MIPIEEQVCTYHQAVELFNLGVKVTPLFIHQSYPDGKYWGIEETYMADKEMLNLPAYTFPELFEMCKGFKDYADDNNFISMFSVKMDMNSSEDLDPKWFEKNTPITHGLADILIHLIKTKQISVVEINKL